MKTLPILLSIVLAGVSFAGELGVYSCPTADPDVTHFRVYAAGSLAATVPIAELVAGSIQGASDGTCPGVTLVGTVLTNAPNDCTARNYVARFAIETAPGVFTESTDSETVVSIARPFVTEVIVGAAGIRQVKGQNFTATTTVSKLDGTPIATTFGSCQILEIEDTATRTIVVNSGLLPFTFTIPVEEPQGVEVN